MSAPTKPTLDIQTSAVSADSKLRKTEKYSRIYSNGVQLSMSPWDIRMDFGQMLDDEPNKPELFSDVSVLMSPSHAVAFLKALENTIIKYENAFGPINDPTAKIKATRAASEAVVPVAPTAKRLPKPSKKKTT